MPRLHQSGYAFLPISRPHTDAKVREVEEFLHARFQKDIARGQLARDVGMSARTLMRRFKTATKTFPGAYLKRIRIAAARQLLENGAPSVSRVGSAVGYNDAAFFRASIQAPHRPDAGSLPRPVPTPSAN
jgi:transcriptional regulator GlxA family with amidase domain